MIPRPEEKMERFRSENSTKHHPCPSDAGVGAVQSAGRLRRNRCGGSGGLVLVVGGMRSVGCVAAAFAGFRSTAPSPPLSFSSSTHGLGARIASAPFRTFGVVRNDVHGRRQHHRRRRPITLRSSSKDEQLDFLDPSSADGESDTSVGILDPPFCENEELISSVAAEVEDQRQNNGVNDGVVDVFSVLDAIDPSDPASILDATIGIGEGDESVEGGAATTATVAPTWNNDVSVSVTTSGGDCGDTSVVDDDIGYSNTVAEILPDATVGDIVDKKNAAETEAAVVPPPVAIVASVDYPSIPKILRLTVPAMGVWLCSPVLSMIDTAAVGLLSGTAQQAALNPAVSVSDFGTLLLAFMFAATTNLVAAARSKDSAVVSDKLSSPSAPLNDGDGRNKNTVTTLVTALRLAVLVGGVLGATLGLSGKFLVNALIGANESLDPAVASSALRYVWIRCLGMPAAAIVGTAQSASLALGDVKSPLMVLVAAALINLFGDAMLVGRSSLWFGGAAGAAWATVLSQYGALFMFMKWMTTKAKTKNSREEKPERLAFSGTGGPVVDVTRGIMELTGTSREGKSRRKKFQEFLHHSSLSTSKKLDDSFASFFSKREATPKMSSSTSPGTRGLLAGKFSGMKDLLRVSEIDRSAAKEFVPFVVPVTTTSLGRISGYIAMSHVASSTLGCFDMAAHQIIFSIFCCLTPLVDALNQVAQSFVPGVYERTPRTCKARGESLRRTVSNFTKCGVGLGAILLGLVSCIPHAGKFFTADMDVLSRVNGAIPGVGLFLALNGLMCAGEGSLMGQKDLKFLRNMYALYFFTVPMYFLRLKRRALAGVQVVGIGTMWAAFSGYQVIRTTVWHLRLRQLRLRNEREVTAAAHCEEGS